MLNALLGPMPGTCSSLFGSFSMISKASKPKYSTNVTANASPIPFISPEPKNLINPALLFGVVVIADSILNCLQNFG